MIKNERQYKITKAQADKLQAALAKQQSAVPPKGVHPLLFKAQQDALQSQIDDLRDELAEYKKLQSEVPVQFTTQSFSELPTLLIKARIAKGLSQKDLADRIGLKEQQIQRYEATNYAAASFNRLLEIVNALDVRVTDRLVLNVPDLDLNTFLRGLETVGLSREFVLSRLVPRELRAYWERFGDQTDVARNLVLQVASAIARVFKVSPNELLGNPALALGTVAGEPSVRFKKPARVDVKRFDVYVTYAHYLANLALMTTNATHADRGSSDPKLIRELILTRYGHLTFHSILHFTWSLGIPVLPLKDPGLFHGACWRHEGRNVIVLKQAVLSPSRWAFDLLHELWHALQKPTEPEMAIIESNEMASERAHSTEEQWASYFAGEVLLAGKGEQLAQKCVDRSQGSVELLKNAVKEVSAETKTPVDSLANYMAFRLSLQGINWWGAATNLQQGGNDPWTTTADVLLQNVNLSTLEETDRTLLMQALSS